MNAPISKPIAEYDPTQDPDFPWPPKDLPETDGEPLESDWHCLEIAFLKDMIRHAWRERDNYYAAGNMFIYFSDEQVRNRDYRGPDFYVVKDVSAHMRRYWAVWDEQGRYPDVIIELMSPTTKKEDLTIKKGIYEKTFRTVEYFAFDPETDELLGWKLIEGQYEPIKADDRGRLWSKELGMWLGTWQGRYHTHTTTWLRFYDESGNVVMTPEEAAKARLATVQQELQATEAEVARLKKLLESQQK